MQPPLAFEVHRILRLQHGVIDHRQARAAGLSRAAIGRLLVASWTEVHRGVYRDRAARPLPHSWAMAALLAVRMENAGEPMMVLWSAARLWRLPVPVPLSERHREHVASDKPGTRRREGIVVHQWVRLPARVMIDGMAVASRPRTVADLVRLLAPVTGDHLVDNVLQAGVVTLGQLREELRDVTGGRGVVRLRQALDRADPALHAVSERQLKRLLRRAGLHQLGRHQLAVRDAAGLVGVLDWGIEGLRVGVEVDGYAWHTERDRFQRDRDKGARLVLAGWRVIHVTAYDVWHRPDHVIALVRALVAHAQQAA